MPFCCCNFWRHLCNPGPNATRWHPDAISQVAPHAPIDGSQMPPDHSRCPRCIADAPRSIHVASRCPRCPQMLRTCSADAPRCPPDAPRCTLDGTRWLRGMKKEKQSLRCVRCHTLSLVKNGLMSQQMLSELHLLVVSLTSGAG